MTNLDQVRKYRLQKSLYKRNVAPQTVEQFKELTGTIDKTSGISVDLENSEQLETHQEENQKYYISGNKFRRIYKNRKHESFPELLKSEPDYSSEDSNSENENSKDNYTNLANKSKLRARYNKILIIFSSVKKMTTYRYNTLYYISGQLVAQMKLQIQKN